MGSLLRNHGKGAGFQHISPVAVGLHRSEETRHLGRKSKVGDSNLDCLYRGEVLSRLEESAEKGAPLGAKKDPPSTFPLKRHVLSRKELEERGP